MPDHDKYQLRPRVRSRPAERARREPQPLSKYRRKTANARERSRMREINRAFEALRRAVPVVPTVPTVPTVPVALAPAAPPPCEKLTKITTLRLAMRYIAELAAALQTPREAPREAAERWPSPLCSDLSASDLSGPASDFAEDSLSPFDSFFAEFDREYVAAEYNAADRSFA